MPKKKSTPAKKTPKKQPTKKTTVAMGLPKRERKSSTRSKDPFGVA